LLELCKIFASCTYVFAQGGKDKAIPVREVLDYIEAMAAGGEA